MLFLDGAKTRAGSGFDPIHVGRWDEPAGYTACMPTRGERATLREHLLATGLCGDTKTTRENTVDNAFKLVDGDPDKALGLKHEGLDVVEVMEAVAALCGCDPDMAIAEGAGYIDPDRTLDELEAYAGRLRDAVRRAERILVCTGHPTGPLAMYTGIARALEEAGCKVLRPLDAEKLAGGGLLKAMKHRGNRVRFFDGVGVLADGASLYHTHEAWPMERLLDTADPDLVLADHGFAGAAIARGIETLAINDINDPSIAVAKARRMIDVVVPLDDNLSPAEVYDPIRDFLVEAIRPA